MKNLNIKEAIQSITAPILRRSNLYQLGSFLQKSMQDFDKLNEQKIHEEKTYGIGTQRRVLTSTFNLGEESFFSKISIPFYVVHSLLGDAESDYGASVIKKIACTYEKLDTPYVDVMNQWEKERFFDQLADHHISEMKKKEGPLQQIFWLLGWSSGGIVALKIAEKLRKEGKEVYLFLLDPTHPRGIRRMSHENHTEMMIKIGNKLLSVAARYAECIGEWKVDCKDDLNAIQGHEEQAAFLFKYVIQKIAVLKRNSHAPLSIEIRNFIDKMIASARMIYQAELAMYEEFNLSEKHDRLFFAKTSDARNGWPIDFTVEPVEIEGDHFQIVNSDFLKNEINGALHKQFKESVNDVSEGIVKSNSSNYKEAAECFGRAVRKNPGDMRAQQMYIQSKLLLNEYATVSDYISNLLSKIDQAGTGNLMKFRKTLKAFDCIAKHFKRDSNKVSLAMHLSHHDMEGMSLDDIEAVSSDPHNLNQATDVPGSFDELLNSIRIEQILTVLNPNQLSIFRDCYKLELIGFLKEDRLIVELLQYSNIFGTNALMNDNFDQAIKHFTNALTKQTPSPFAYSGRACAYYLSGDRQAALKDLDMGILKFPNFFCLRAIRGTILYLSNQFIDAQDDLKKALALKPENECVINRLILSFRKTNLKEAINWAQYYIDHVSKNVMIGYLHKGSIYLDMNELAPAEEALSKGIKISPHVAAFYVLRGETHFQLNNPKATIQDSTEALRLEPNLQAALMLRVNAYMVTGQFDACINDLKQWLVLHPNDTTVKMTLLGLEQNLQYVKSGKILPMTLAKIFEKQLLHSSCRTSASEDGLIHLQTMGKLFNGMPDNPKMPEILGQVACSTPLSQTLYQELKNDQKLQKILKPESSTSDH